MTQLESFVDRLIVVADRRNLAYENPITIMIDVGNSQFYVVVGYKEPNHVTLPMNVTWIVCDPDSPHYRKALRRASAIPFDGFRNTWAELRTYEDFVEEPQFWDLSATFQFGEVQVTGVKAATPTMRGLFKLKDDPADPASPVVVSNEDPRMSNARQPLPHTHPLLPATMLEGSTGIDEFFVHISDGKSPRAGEVLALTEPAEEPGEWNGVWRAIEAADIVYDGPVVVELVINGPTDETIDEGTPVPFTVDAVFSDGTTRRSIPATWEIIANKEAGSISTSTGVFTSKDVSGDQLVRIRASWRHEESGESHSATYDLTVIDNTVTAVLERVELAGATELDEGGNTTAYTVTAFYDDGSSRGVTPTTFTSSNPAAGTLNSSTAIFTSTIDATNDQVTTLAVTYTEAGVTKSHSLDLTVIDTTVYPMSAEIVGPEVVSENTEVTYILNVTFTDLTSSQVAVSDWTLSNANAGTLGASTGILVAPPDLADNETAQISASFTSNGRTVSDILDISVTDDTVYPLSATIEGPTQINEDQVQLFKLRVFFSDGTDAPVAVEDWTTSNAVAGTLGATSGEFISSADVPANTTTSISASYTLAGVTVSDTHELTVLDVTNYPVSVKIIGSDRMGEGTSQTLTLEVTYQDASTRTAPAASWLSSDSVLLSVDATGNVSAQDELRENKFASITAEYSEAGVDLSDTLTITVTDDTKYPTGAVIVGPEVVNENTTVSYTLEVTFEGGEKKILPVETFAISDPALGSITNDGRLTAPSDVPSDISGKVTASYTLDGESVSAELDIRVTDDTVYPASAVIIGPTLIDEETTHTYELQVTYTDTTKHIRPVADWNSTNTAVAKIDPDTGVLTALSIPDDGMTTISASFTEHGVTVGHSVDVTVEDVTNYPVSAVIVGRDDTTPLASIDEDGTAQYDIKVTFNDGTSQVMPASNWSQSNSNAGVLSSAGDFQAKPNLTADETTIIKATYTAYGETVEATHSLTVVDRTAYPISAEILGPVTVNEEQTASYTLRVSFDNGDNLVMPVEDWASSNDAAGSIDLLTGVFTAAVNDTRANVTTDITASWTVDGETASDTLTIGVVDTTTYVSTVKIVGPDSVDEGDTATYQFELTDDEGNPAIVTADSWSLDNGSAAYIDEATGELTADDDITSDRTVTISASYVDSMGIPHGTSKVIDILDTKWRPASLAINGADSLLEGDAVTYSATVTYDNGKTATVALSDWAVDDETVATIADTGELTGKEVAEDTEVVISGSYTEHGVTAPGLKTVTVTDIYPTGASIQGPASLEGGNTASYTFVIDRSNGETAKPRVIDTWALDPIVDADGNPITAADGSEIATIDSTGALTTSVIESDMTITVTGSYTEGTRTVDATYTVNLVAEIPPEAPNPRWGYATYAGPTLNANEHTGAQAFIEALANELPDRTSGNLLSYNLPDGSTYAYLAYPKDMGRATFTDEANGLTGSWDGATWLDDYSNMDDVGPIEVTFDAGNGAGPQTWYVYRTDWPGPATSSFKVDFAGV